MIKKREETAAASDAEIVAKAIAEGIAEGRRHGFEMAQG